MNHLMIDLETMGTNVDAAIASIGAAYFDPRTGDIGQTFYQNVELETCFNVGLKAHGDTIGWWLRQKDEARLALLENRMPIHGALLELKDFCGHTPGHVWSHATFDMPIINNAYNACGMRPPWNYSAARDIRTLTHLASNCDDVRGAVVTRQGTHHNALDDCIYQIQYVGQLWRAICERG